MLLGADRVSVSRWVPAWVVSHAKPACRSVIQRSVDEGSKGCASLEENRVSPGGRSWLCHDDSDFCCVVFLCCRARELSLDNTRDSPFALLAKENDIMWGGGMPDDITIIAIRVTDKAQSSADVSESDAISVFVEVWRS